MPRKNQQIGAHKMFRANYAYRVQQTSMLMMVLVFATLIVGVAGLGTLTA